MMASLRIVQTSQSDPREISLARQKQEETLEMCEDIDFSWGGEFFFWALDFFGEGGGVNCELKRILVYDDFEICKEIVPLAATHRHI